VSPETLKLPEENMVESTEDISIGNRFPTGLE
jgi:hypothetical protein